MTLILGCKVNVEELTPRAASDVQHEYIHNHYVIPIAVALRQLDNKQYPLEDYLGFALDGLRGYGNKWENVEYDIGDTAKVLKNTNFNKDCNE